MRAGAPGRAGSATPDTANAASRVLAEAHGPGTLLSAGRLLHRPSAARRARGYYPRAFRPRPARPPSGSRKPRDAGTHARTDGRRPRRENAAAARVGRDAEPERRAAPA